jgi:hypothetical protein
MRLRKPFQVQGEAANADMETAVSYLEDQAEIRQEAATLNNRLSMMMKQPHIGKRCHLGVSKLERRSQGQISKL